jgi:hypothetical protein
MVEGVEMGYEARHMTAKGTSQRTIQRVGARCMLLQFQTKDIVLSISLLDRKIDTMVPRRVFGFFPRFSLISVDQTCLALI